MRNFLVFLLGLVAITSQASTYYGFKIGGVAVNSDNYQNVTGSNIKRGTVKYDPDTKTVTLTNVTIRRSGSDNRAIYNESRDFLKVRFVGTDTLYAANAAPVRLDHATKISFYCDEGAKVLISGGSEGAIYLKNTTTGSGHETSVTFYGGNYTITSQGGYAIEGSGGMSNVYFSNDARVSVFGTKGDLRHLCNVVFNSTSENKNGRVIFRSTGTSAAQVQEVEQLLLYRPSWFNLVSPEGAYYNSGSQTIKWDDGDITQKNIIYVEALAINNINFPDAALRSALSSYAKTYNGFLTLSEINNIKNLQLDDKGISSLKGIEYFPNLTYLYCNNNNLTELDISKNPKLKILYCNRNKLTQLDYSANEELSELYCNNNELQSLSGIHPALTKLQCSGNKISTMTLNAPKLTSLMCSKNKLTGLGSSHLPELKTLDCSSNQLTYLLIEDCTKLERLYCSSNKLKNLNVSTFASLVYLDCSNNELEYVNMSANTALKTAFVYSNKIKISMQTLINNLPEMTTWSSIYLEDLDNPEEGNVVPFAKTMDARAKKWQPFYNKNDVWTEYESDPLVINATNFPDARFRNWLLEKEYGKDTYLIKEELDTIIEMNPRALGIMDMTGIGYFTSLQKLNCELNSIKGENMDNLLSQVPLSVIEGGFHLYNTFDPDFNEGNEITNDQVKAAYDRGVIPYRFDGSEWIPFTYSLYARGDLNHDGSVNAGDISELYKTLLSGIYNPECDLNGDGNINAGDVSQLYSIILGR